MNNTPHHSNMFLRTARLEFIQNRKHIFLVLVGILLLYALTGAFAGYIHAGGGSREIIAFEYMALIVAVIANSLAFSNLKTKELRIYSLMLPASPFVKLAVRWLALVPLLMIYLYAMFYIGDMSRIATFALFEGNTSNYPHYMTIVNPWDTLCCKFAGTNGTALAFVVFSTFIFYTAAYHFGAVLWPKLSFIKTFVALTVIQAAITSIVSPILSAADFCLTSANFSSVLWVVFGIELALTLLLYLLTWRRLKATDVVYHLFY